jgi:phosphoglycolate phosphatase
MIYPELYERLRHAEHVIWDWNGTLLDDLAHNVRIMNQLLSRQGLNSITVEQHRSCFRFPVVEYYAALGFDTRPEVFPQLCLEFTTRYEAELDSCAVLPGMKELVLALQTEERTQSVLSATRQDALERALKLYRLEDQFSYVYGLSDHTATSKVARGFDLLRNANINPDRTILIGDTDHDAHVGAALGIDVILVDHGHQDHSRLIAVHQTVFRSYQTAVPVIAH